MSDSPLQHMKRVFSGVEGINEAELRRQLGEWVSALPPCTAVLAFGQQIRKCQDAFRCHLSFERAFSRFLCPAF